MVAFASDATASLVPSGDHAREHQLSALPRIRSPLPSAFTTWSPTLLIALLVERDPRPSGDHVTPTSRRRCRTGRSRLEGDCRSRVPVRRALRPRGSQRPQRRPSGARVVTPTSRPRRARRGRSADAQSLARQRNSRGSSVTFSPILSSPISTRLCPEAPSGSTKATRAREARADGPDRHAERDRGLLVVSPDQMQSATTSCCRRGSRPTCSRTDASPPRLWPGRRRRSRRRRFAVRPAPRRGGDAARAPVGDCEGRSSRFRRARARACLRRRRPRAADERPRGKTTAGESSASDQSPMRRKR